MTENRIERVARALFEHEQFDADMVFEDFKDEFIGTARVAIAAMEQDEPTEEMVEVGLDILYAGKLLMLGMFRRELGPTMAAIYKAMRAKAP